MTHLSDETLMAYADGQLTAVETARIERLVASDPELRARLEVFQTTGRHLAALFDDHLNARLPPRLKRFTLAPQANLSKIFDFGSRRRGQLLSGFGALRLAAASAAMLAIGIGIGWLTHRSSGGTPLGELVGLGDERMIARPPLQLALDTLPGGKEAAVPLSGGKTSKVAVLLSFVNHNQNYCRRYEIGLSSPERYGGIACHLDGEWKIELHAVLPPRRIQSGKASPAGNESRALEAAVMAAMDGDALGREDEAALIRGGWKKN